jgi:hypothetical protein
MYIGTRKTALRQHDDSCPFDVFAMIDLGKIDGGGLLDLANGRSTHTVRLHERNATEFNADMYGRPLTAFDARIVLSAIKADMLDRDERGARYQYQLALAALEILLAYQPSTEVVLEAYTSGNL